jgi:tetratricopeptide (TPR) repeat protein
MNMIAHCRPGGSLLPSADAPPIRTRLLYFVWAFFLLSSQAVSLAGDPESSAAPDNPALIMQAMELLNQGKHDSVLAISSRVIAGAPESPVGYFLAADVYQTLMRDYRVKNHEAEFDSLIRIAAAKASLHLTQNPTAENHFITGTVKGYYCLALFQNGSYLKALKEAEKSISLLNKSAKMAPDFVDPLFGIAIFEYNKSKLLFGLLGGSEKKAFATLQRVEQHGRYVGVNASYALQAIYYEHEQYDSALVINDKLFQRYPENPSCLYNRARLLEKLNRPTEALAIWQKLITIVGQSRPASNGYLAECHYHLALIHHQRREHPVARDLLIQAARYASRRRSEEEGEGSFVKFDEIKNEINAALREWGRE